MNQRFRDLSLASFLTLPVVLLIAWPAGYALARRVLKPIEKMAREAREITPEKLHARLRIDDTDDELGQLARVFNETLARLEQAFEQLRRFTSDEIKDHGPGIPFEDQPKIFDRFYRVDKARWRESGGAGLGLSIAKWAVEAHGGAVSLESEPGKGCAFRITLPRAEMQPKGEKSAPIPEPV